MDAPPKKNPETKPTGRRYSSVEDMLRGERVADSVASQVEKLSQETRLTRALATLRAKGGLTQEEFGRHMDPPRTQSAISKLESGSDDDLTIGDVRSYSRILTERIGMVFGPQLNHVEAINLHAKAMRSHLLELAKIARADDQLEKEIQAFFGEAFFNLLSIMATCAGEMPKSSGFEVKIEILGQARSAPAIRQETQELQPV